MVVELGLFELTVSLESNELWCGVQWTCGKLIATGNRLPGGSQSET